MQDGGELNVTNPVYMRKDPGEDEDEDDEEEPLGAGLIYTGNTVSLEAFCLSFGSFFFLFFVYCPAWKYFTWETEVTFPEEGQL